MQKFPFASPIYLQNTKKPVMMSPYWSHRLAVRTPDSHSGNRGSIPLGTAKIKVPCDSGVILFCCMSHGESNTGMGVRPAAKRRAEARRFASANFARAAPAKPLGTAKIKSVDLFDDFYFALDFLIILF